MGEDKDSQPSAAANNAVDDTRNTEEDERAMAEVGKVQQLKRSFGFWTILGLTASMMCTWEAVWRIPNTFLRRKMKLTSHRYSSP